MCKRLRNDLKGHSLNAKHQRTTTNPAISDNVAFTYISALSSPFSANCEVYTNRSGSIEDTSTMVRTACVVWGCSSGGLAGESYFPSRTAQSP